MISKPTLILTRSVRRGESWPKRRPHLGRWLDVHVLHGIQLGRPLCIGP